MGAMQRNKGARGQSEFASILRERDWTVDPITAGVMREDMIATDSEGRQWSVEVKNTATITKSHRKQAMEQSARRKLPWMLANKIAGTSSWLVQRKGEKPVVWNAKINRIDID